MLFIVMPHPFCNVHGVGIGGIGIRIYGFVRPPALRFSVHDFPITVFFDFPFFLYALLFADNKSRVF